MSSSRPIENVTPGGIEAVIVDLGDPVRRLLLAQRRVGHLLERRGLDDQVGQRRSGRSARRRSRRPAGPRPCAGARLLAELLLGRRVARPCCAPCPRPAAACSAAASAASCARLRKLIGAESSRASYRVALTTRIQRRAAPPDAPRRRPVRPPRDPRRREPRGHRGRLARRSSASTIPTSPGPTGSSAPSGSTSPTTG